MRDHAARRRVVRLLTFLCGAAILIWLSLEDHDVSMPVLAGLALMAVLAANILLRWSLARIKRPAARFLGGLLAGASIGAGTALAAAFLMLFKTGLHSHAAPDYPVSVILDTLGRAPIWALAGALAAAGVSFACHALTAPESNGAEGDR